MKKVFFIFLSVLIFSFANAQDPAPVDSLKIYAGKYKFPDGSPVTEVNITVENGLLMASSAMGSTEFKPAGIPDIFEVVAYSGKATFKRKEGKITGVQIVVGEINLEGTKGEEGQIPGK